MATKEGLFSYYYINLYCAICSSSVKSWAWEWVMSDYVYTYRNEIITLMLVHMMYYRKRCFVN